MRMGKLVAQGDMELMKMAMLKHEETFRQQVHELHRLYYIQKQLMSDMSRCELGCRRQRRKQPQRALNLQLPADEYIVSAGEDDAMPSGEHELELTLAIGGRRARKKGEQQGAGGAATPFASDSSTSLSSSSTESGGALQAPPYQRAIAFEPWLVQCQYLSLRMT